MHRPPDPAGVERAEQEAHVGIAEIGLVSRRRAQLRHHDRQDAVRAIAAAQEPDRVETGIVGEFEEGVGAALIAAGEMAVDLPALRVDDQVDLGIGERGEGDERRLGILVADARRRHHSNPHACVPAHRQSLAPAGAGR